MPVLFRSLQERVATDVAERYRVERELGRGASAVVYLAYDRKHGREVALKVLDPVTAPASGAARFHQEIALLARLQHPHILALYDSGEAAGSLYFVTPYVAGESLRARLERQGALPPADALRAAWQVADALAFAHGRGVVHRDVKPDNVLLTADAAAGAAAGTTGGETAGTAAGADWHAVVADFGIARFAHPEGAPGPGAGGAYRTDVGDVLGTAAYMAPEQAHGAPEVDARADVWAVGLVLYEMLTGRLPHADAPTVTLARVRRYAGPPPALVLAGVPREALRRLDALFARALAPDPDARFATARELAAAVAGVQAALIASRPLASPRARWAVAAAAAALVGAVAAAAGWPWGAADHAGRDAVALAVLPFENQGDSADAYFADGVADELRGRLSALGGLRVVASASSKQYRATSKSQTQIARELGVRYLLVGRVRRSRGAAGERQIRVAPELVDVTGGPAPAVRWQQSFDGPLADVFRVQDEIAARVAERLQVALAAGEAGRPAPAPVAGLDAYDLYLRAQGALARGGPDDLREASALYGDVVRRDTASALAWAGIATAEASLYNIDQVGAAEHRDAARRAAERALALAPELPDVRAAVAHYTTLVRKDPARALADLAAARARAPYHALLLRRVANAERVLGRLDTAVARSREVLRLDPRSAGAYYYLGLSLFDLRRHDEARRAFDRTTALQPAAVYPWVKRALVEVAVGDSARARAVLRGMRPAAEPSALAASIGRMGYHAVWLLDSAAQRAVRAGGAAAFGADDRGNAALVLARLFALHGDSARARAYADTAAAALGRQVRTLGANPQVAAEVRARAAVAFAYAGRAAEAVREAEAAAAVVPPGTGEHPIAHNVQLELVRVYLLAGDRDRALAHLAPLLRAPGVLSPGWLRVDPTFAPLRDDPRFARLAAGRG